MGSVASGFCFSCGNRILGRAHKLAGRSYCGDCYIKAAKSAKSQDDALSELYAYLKKLFGATDIPLSIQSAVDRRLEEGCTIPGLRFTVYYYYEVQGNDPNDITKVSWVIRDMYEEARSYVEEMKRLGEQNKDVPIHEPEVVAVRRPTSKRRVIKRWKMED